MFPFLQLQFIFPWRVVQNHENVKDENIVQEK